MSTYPSELDSDIEIPRVDKEVSEISGDVINSLRDAIFSIQRVIGLSPQGNKSSFVDRINVSIDQNGNIKASSLEQLGLLALPIINKHVGVTAGIEEKKLALDYGTAFLKNKIDSLRTDVSGISAGLSGTTSAFSTHLLGQGNFHDGYHIKIDQATNNGIAGLSATTVGDAINEISTILLSGDGTSTPHIDLSLPTTIKHMATDISVDATSFTNISRTSENVQEALSSIDASAGALGVAHVDSFHANGVLKKIDSTDTYNPNIKLLSGVTDASYTKGTSVIKIPGVSSFSNLGISVGDVLEIESDVIDQGAYKIRAIGPLLGSDTLGSLPSLDADELSLFYTFKGTSTGSSLSVYKPSASSSEFAPMACAVVGSETLADTISVMDPSSARVVSIGFNGSILNGDGYELGIKVGIDSSRYREIIIPGLNLDRLGGQTSVVHAGTVAERINAFVIDPDLGYNFPITAYEIGDELAIAHNWVGENYTIEIADGYTGNYALGFDAYGADVVGLTVVGNDNASCSINGVSINSLAEIVSGTVSITSDSSTLTLKDSSGNTINPLIYGIGPGSIMHVSGHPTLEMNGSYVLLGANSTSVSLFSSQKISAPSNPTTFSFMFSSANVPLSSLDSTEVDKGIVQILVNANAKTMLHQRLTYGTSLGSAINIINVSYSFPIGDILVLATLNGNYVDFNIVDDTVSGETLRIHEDFKGTFKLYHPNGLDYLTIRISDGSISGGLETITVSAPLPTDESFALCTAHFDGTHTIDSMFDSRLFGNISANEIRDDFIETFSQKPVSDLRSDGVARGFDLLDIPYYDSVTNMAALPLRGGIAYVNGVRLAIETQKVLLQTYDQSGSALAGEKRIVGINDFGSLQVLDDDLGEILTDGYVASAKFGQVLPLYQVTIDNSGLIGEVIDIRKFINKIDEKISLIVDESNSVVGNFRSLEGALLYASSYPSEEKLTIKIINSVYPQNQIVVPKGISIIGEASFGAGKHRVVNSINHNGPFITLLGDNRLENIGVVSSTAGLQGSLVLVEGSNVNVEKCSFNFEELISSNSGDLAINITGASNVRIVNNRIDNVFGGIYSDTGCNNLVVSDNHISGVSGVGGISNAIKIGTSYRSVDNITITNNIIELDATAETDIRGIFTDIGQEILTLRIQNNNISGALDITSENHLSNGIRISNESATGNTVNNLFLQNNHIKNVSLRDSSVYGIYVSSINRAIISNNILNNIAIYDSNYANTGFIWVDANVDVAEIDSNVLDTGEALRGIYTVSTSTKASITNNSLRNVGNTNCKYIYGTSHRANISNNKLTGPGDYGIHWKGEQTKIYGNILDASEPGTNYSFGYGIYFEASYVDIENNMLLNMDAENCLGIKNKNSAAEGAKIIGNTINGDNMTNLVDVAGNYHIINNNRLKNSSLPAVGDTIYIKLGTNADSVSIVGNTLEGVGTYGIYAADKVTNIAITSNNIITTNLTGAPLRMANSEVSGCLLSGNVLPDSSAYVESLLQVGPAYGAGINENIIGINKGYPSTKSYPASAATTSYYNANTPDWIFVHDSNGGGGGGKISYWHVNSYVSSNVRALYFPITDLHNGSKITGLQVQGRNISQADDTFTVYLVKTPITTVSGEQIFQEIEIASDDMSVANDNFGYTYTTNVYGYIDGLEEPVDGDTYHYSIKIEHIKQAPTSAENIRIYGAVLFFKQ